MMFLLTIFTICLSSLAYSQGDKPYVINPGGVITYIGGETVEIPGDLTTKQIYGLGTFKDSAVTISTGTNVLISNSYKNLFIKAKSSIVTWSGDTAVLQKAGNYAVYFSLYGTGLDSSSWKISMAKKRATTVTYTEDFGIFYTNGTASNKYGGCASNYLLISGASGDKIYFTLSRLTGTGTDFTARYGSFKIMIIR